jgi:hypothetical protein
MDGYETTVAVLLLLCVLVALAGGIVILLGVS